MRRWRGATWRKAVILSGDERAHRPPPMSVRIVRLGSPRRPDEGLRIGTVRRPPRGVPKTQFASGDWYDLWYPVLAPSVETLQLGKHADTPAWWAAFARKYR